MLPRAAHRDVSYTHAENLSALTHREARERNGQVPRIRHFARRVLRRRRAARPKGPRPTRPEARVSYSLMKFFGILRKKRSICPISSRISLILLTLDDSGH